MKSKRILIILCSCLLLVVFNNKIVSAENNKSEPRDVKMKATGKSVDDFIPNDWKVISKVQGDLNKDKLKDIAVVMEYTGDYIDNKEEDGFGRPRMLFIIFQKKDNSYKLAVQSSNVIMREGEGGVFGDPFTEIKYSRGAIVVSFYGGSSLRWGYDYRFRYQKKDWYLIGESKLTQNINTGEVETIDTNCITGKQIITSVDLKGKEKVVTRNIGKLKLKKLTEW